MPALKVTATIGSNSYTAEGELTFDAAFARAFTALIVATVPGASTDHATADRIAHDTLLITHASDAIGAMADSLGSVAPDGSTKE